MKPTLKIKNHVPQVEKGKAPDKNINHLITFI